jgi:shikimate 5-dehydrogenase
VLVHQALRQIELVTGKRPDPEPLLAAGEAARAAR